MRTRDGFVSNSSSTSFVILGVGITDEMGRRIIQEGSRYTLKHKMWGCPRKFKGLDVIWDYNGAIVGKCLHQWQALDKKKNTFAVGRHPSQDASDAVLFMHKHASSDSDSIKKALAPLGLWNEDSFGVYCGTVNN